MTTNPKITADTTYSELKAMVPDVSDQHTPQGKTLAASDEPILTEVQEGNIHITVYKNGFFTAKDDRGRITARAVHNCSTLYLPTSSGGFTAIPESEYKEKI